MNAARSVFCCMSMLLGSVLATVAVGADDLAAERGAELLGPFKQELKQALLAGMQSGPESAISVCKENAPSKASELSVGGVLVGRTSHKLRNPVNTAPGWVTPVLEAYLSEGSDRTPAVVPLAANRIGYVEPIVMQALCLTCHGDAVQPGLAARIREDYPEDEATGFSVGDLRGVFWAEFPASR